MAVIDPIDAKSLSYWGEHLIVGLRGSVLEAEEAAMLSELKPLGIVLFAKNIDRSDLETNPTGWIDRLRTLLTEARAAIGRRDLIVSIDHEGGRVHRLPPPITRFPAAVHWRESAYDVAVAMAKELRALGMTLTFSPVLDVFSEPQNTVIGPRAFDGAPPQVAECGKQFLAGLADGGILSCVKHFPGHGATVSDSHFELPYLDASSELLEQRELVPFKAAIREGVPLVMTAHVVYRALDPENAATLSPTIIDGLLRRTLGYSGVVVTDDLEMHALAEIGPEQIAVRAINAGVDLLLEANPKEQPAVEIGLRMAAALRSGYESGEIESGRLIRSRERIKRLLARQRELLSKPVPDESIGLAAHALLAQNLTPQTSA